jgi:phosphoglycerate dehydrogenase-like enzyme
MIAQDFEAQMTREKPHMGNRPIVVIQGAEREAEVPGVERISGRVDLRPAKTTRELGDALPDAEILLGWDFRAGNLEEVWDRAEGLRWIHWSGVGVDALLFPELVESEVILTNSSGVFKRAMAEYVLGLILCFAKGFPETARLQERREWGYRLTERIDGCKALIVGVGHIGREIATLLKLAGLEVRGVGRRARGKDPLFGDIYASKDLLLALAWADFVIDVLPLTVETHHVFGAREFDAMRAEARFINVGRGATVDEEALHRALGEGSIGGAALDCYEQEPLPSASPLWSAPNLIISPHMSGDYRGHTQALADVFFRNLERYLAGEPLINVVDKRLGYIPSDH